MGCYSMNTLFTDNAFLFLLSRDRIIRDERLYFVEVELPEVLTFVGGFKPMTLGEYVRNCLNLFIINCKSVG